MTERSYGLGRLVKPDERDRLHLMAAHLPPREAAVPPVSRYWRPGPVLDQGETSMCTAYAWTGFLNATPYRTGVPPTYPADLYAAEQRVDEIPLPHDGSTVRAGAKILASQGHLKEYVWATTLDDLVRWVLLKGPVVVGTDWYERMFVPDYDGTVRLGGSIAGGHAWLVTGVDTARRRARARNSWGAAWGIRGDFWIGLDDLGTLLEQDGEAATAAEIRVKTVPA